jgi:hypothetical protein
MKITGVSKNNGTRHYDVITWHTEWDRQACKATPTAFEFPDEPECDQRISRNETVGRVEFRVLKLGSGKIEYTVSLDDEEIQATLAELARTTIGRKMMVEALRKAEAKTGNDTTLVR